LPILFNNLQYNNLPSFRLSNDTVVLYNWTVTGVGEQMQKGVPSRVILDAEMVKPSVYFCLQVGIWLKLRIKFPYFKRGNPQTQVYQEYGH